MGKGGSQTIGYKYYLGKHSIVCQGPIDYITRFRFGEKIAWTGKNAGGQIYIDKPNLFGGKKKEGGVGGKIDIEMGYPTQGQNDYLVDRLGDRVPGYRGVVGYVFRQFYWGNNPYLKPWDSRGQRIYVRQDGISQWYSGKAGVPYYGQDEFPFEVPLADGPSSSMAMAFSEYSNIAYEYIGSGWFRLWELDFGANVRTALTSGLGFSSIQDVSIDSDGTAHYIVVNVGTVQRGSVSIDGTVTYFDIPSYTTLNWEQVEVLEPSPGEGHFYACPDSGTVEGYIYGPPHFVTAGRKYYNSLSARHFAISDEGEIVGVFQPTVGSDQFSLCVMDAIGEVVTEHIFTADVARVAPTSASLCHVAFAHHWFVTMDGYFYLIDDDTFTIKDSGVLPGSGTLRLRAQVSHPTVGWRRWDEISLVTGALLRSVDPLDWTPGPGISESGYWYDHYNHAIWSQHNGGADPLYLRYLDRGAYDMNPAHIIRECLTDPDWGMGYTDDDIDDVSFAAAADTLWDEGLGMSLLWDKQGKIEDFVNVVMKHADCAVYVSRSTGKFVIKLIRGDYDIDDLIHLDESNIISVENPVRVSSGELTNTVTVTYWEASTGKDTPISVSDPALVQEQAGEISVPINYPGFSNGRNGAIAAARDLRVLSSLLFSCTIIAKKEANVLNLGDVFLHSWTKTGLSNVVMRVTGISYGTGRNNRVKITCTEDVFDTNPNPVVISPDTDWVDPSGPPTPATDQLAGEVPYYEAVQNLGQTTVDNRLADAPEVGFVFAAAGYPESAINASLYTNAGSGYVDVGTLDFCPIGTLSANIGQLDTSFTLTNIDDFEDIESGTFMQLGEEIMRVDGVTSGGIVSVGRGVLDTVPQLHSAGEIAFFWDVYRGYDGTEYVLGEEIGVKVITQSGSGVLAVGAAPESIVTMNQRAFRPYPPGDLRINGESYGEGPYEDDLTITWTDRDRLQQTGAVLYDHTFGDIGPEAGTIYNVRGYIEGLEAFNQEPATSGTIWSPAYSGFVRIEVWSKRDDVYSWQGATHEFLYSAASEIRVTEDDEIRVTEDGDVRVRITEG